ncbi:MAG: hypothetical protein EON48_05975 [Acetobacteraceae bacterium]|nr:MAG: hypothetical protein EON48_05975 [Acetobacteraceae bacterium]
MALRQIVEAMRRIMAMRTDSDGDVAMALKAAGKAAVTVDPAGGAFDDPTLWQDNEAVVIAAAHNFYRPRTGVGDNGGHRSLTDSTPVGE